MRLHVTLLIFFGACLPAHGIEAPPFDISQFADPIKLLLDDASRAIIKTVGIAASHRAYEPATPLGIQVGLDASIDVTLVKVSQDFMTALSTAGLSNASAPTMLLPVPRLSLHKGLGERVDVGGSFVGYRGYRIIGTDVKLAIWLPSEGPTWALRLSYANAKLGYVETKTLTPELLVSKNLTFADPYLGIGYQFVYGKLTVSLPVPPPLPPTEYSAQARAGAFLAFIGVGLRIPRLAVKLTVEQAYNSAGAHTLGAKFGFNF